MTVPSKSHPDEAVANAVAPGALETGETRADPCARFAGLDKGAAWGSIGVETGSRAEPAATDEKPGGTLSEKVRRALRHSRRASFLLISDFEAFRRQESSLILLNLGILACLVLIQVLFIPAMGVPPRLLLLLLSARFTEQAVEFLWLQGRKKPLRPRTTFWYSRFSVWAHVAFAFLVPLVSYGEDSHYWVLMILPIAAAAFRFSWLGTFFVALVGGGLNQFHVWFFFHFHPPTAPAEYFEATTVALLFLVVAVVVWLLANYLREEEIRLHDSLKALRAAQKELVSKERMAAVGQLAGAIAHEIRNPVGMIVSSVAMVKQEGLAGDKQKEVCDILLSESQRLERLSGDFLAFARAREPERRFTSARTTLEYVACLAKAQANERGLPIRIDCPEDFEGFFDPFQVHQALLNLVVNALDASPRECEIILRGRPGTHPGSARFEVENPVAARIPEKVRNQMFEPFFTTKPGGTGLGLGIAQNIAHAHQGAVDLVRNDSERVVFAMTLGGKEDDTE